jgi:hypothetical protein
MNKVIAKALDATHLIYKENDASNEDEINNYIAFSKKLL